MAKMLTKEPYRVQGGHNAFLRDLKQFHESRGTPFRRIPSVNGREVDLFQLYNEVTNLGGWRKVNDGQRWDIILQKLNLPKACANGGLALKHIYIRYLDHYEKIHYLGEDPDDDVVDCSDRPTRKSQNLVFLVPLSYNQHQHEVSESVRNQVGMSLDFASVTDYEKLMLSLQSGLPNEVDFALNVCTLLSNEGRHTLRLEKAPRLIDFLVSHAGVWTEGNTSLKDVLEGSWSRLEGRQLPRFWLDTVDDREVRDLYFKGHTLTDKERLEETDLELFNMSRELGVRDVEGQRILQIANILWNLSFEENNVPVLASSPTCLKFLFLCVHCKWGSLRQLGLDTLGNISAEISLDPLDCLNVQVIFRTLSRSLTSNDRFLVIRGLEILTGLCKTEGNEEMILKSLDRRIYEQICSLLTVHDIMLLVYTLECLYYLTDLGHDACANVACIHKVVEVLVSLITVEAQSYGPTACISMKVVETAVSIPVPAVLPVTPRPPPVTTPMVTQRLLPVSTPIIHGYQEADNDTFAYNWLKAYYEWSPNNSVKQNELYVDYQTTCNKLGKKGLVPPSQLLNLLKTLYAQLKTRPADVQSYRSTEVHLEGIRRRNVPLPVSIYMPARTQTTSSPGSSSSGIIRPGGASNMSSSPILKAQLSAPPRTPPTGSAASQHPHLQQALLGRVQPSSTRPTAATPPSSSVVPRNTTSASAAAAAAAKDSSTLIKSLLANKVRDILKVNQNMLLRQQQQQQQQQKQQQNQLQLGGASGVSKLINSIKMPVKKVDYPQQNTPTNADGQQRVVRIVKVLSPATPVARSKEPIVTTPVRPRSPKLRLNGLPRNSSVEVCAHVEQAKDLVDTSEFHEARIERIENHLLRTGGSDTASDKRRLDLSDNSEPTLDKLLRSSSGMPTSRFQNGVSSSQNGNRSETESPKFVTMEASPPLGLGDNTVRRKGVLADLLEGKVHKDALLTMNGIVDRSVLDTPTTTNPSSVNNNNSVVTTAASMVTTTSTVTATSVNIPAGSRLVVVKSVTPLTNGEGLASKVDTIKVTTAGKVDTSDTTNTVFVPGIKILPVKLSLSSDSEELIGFPRVSMEQLNQLRQQAESLRNANKRLVSDGVGANVTTGPSDPKRPRVTTEEDVSSSNNSSSVATSEAKRARIDEKLSGGVLSPLEAQKQVSAVLQGSSFAERSSTASSSSSASESKRLSGDTSQTVAAKSRPVVVAAVATAAGSATVTKGKQLTTTSPAVPDKDKAKAKDAAATTSDSEKKPQSSAAPSKLEYICEWKECLKTFESPMAVFVHSCKAHAPKGSPNIPCQWEGCDQMMRQRLSLMTHLQDRHCNDQMMRTQATRRQQLTQKGSSTIPAPTPPAPHPGYAPNAAVQAIRRHALEFMAQKEIPSKGIVSSGSATRLPLASLAARHQRTASRTDPLPVSVLQDEREGPVTKSIRLTAALILRNLVAYSSLAKSFVRKYEAHLSMIAMSNVEASRTVAQCLWELNRQTEPKVR